MITVIVREMPGDWSRATIVFPGGRAARVVHVCGPNPDEVLAEAEKYLGRVPPTLRALAEYRLAPRSTWNR